MAVSTPHGVTLHKGVLLKGLPFASTEEDIKTFLKPLQIPKENIRLLKYLDGRGTGLAFVRLKDKEEISHALLMDKNHIGDRYVEVAESDESELHQLMLRARSGMPPAELHKVARSNDQYRHKRDRSPIRKRLETRFLYIKGIPPGHTYKEVRKFFSGLLIARNCVHLIKDSRGQFRGDGYVEFSNNVECRKALQWDGRMMDGSVVYLEPCTDEEVEQVREYLEETDGGRSHSRWKDRTPSPVRRRLDAYAATYGRETASEHEAAGDYYGRYEERDDPQQRYDQYDRSYDARARTSALYANPYSSHDSSYHDPYGTYSRQVQQLDYPRSTSGSIDHYSGSAYSHHTQTPSAHPHGERGYLSSHYRVQQAYSGRGGHPEETSISHMRLAPLPLPGVDDSLSRERRVVRMEGLPYNVTISEILAFFRGYTLDYENVRIQCREDGSQSGKAFITFPSEKHARVAVSDHNKRYIGGRFIELFLV